MKKTCSKKNSVYVLTRIEVTDGQEFEKADVRNWSFKKLDDAKAEMKRQFDNEDGLIQAWKIHGVRAYIKVANSETIWTIRAA